MKTIDYIYRFDPKNAAVKPLPATSETAKRELEVGNQMFAEWMKSCQLVRQRPVNLDLSSNVAD